MDVSIRGSNEGGSTSVKQNTALIRKRIRSIDLKVRERKVGVRSRTNVDILYMEALIFPTDYNSFIKTADDYFERWQIAAFTRALRYAAAFLSMVLPGLYLAVTNYHTQILPTKLLLSFAAARQGGPFPSVIEVLLMELSFELLREAGVRLPGIMGNTIGIVGVAALGIGACSAFFLLGLWEHLADRGAFSDFGRNRKPLLHRILSVCAGAGMSGIAVFTLFMLTSLLEEHLMGTSYVPVILLSLTVAGIFGLTRGLETRVRVYEILFYFLLIPLVLILILACVNVNPVCWTQTSCSVPGFIKSCYGCFLFFSGASVILLCRTHCNQPEYAIRSARCGILTAAVLNAKAGKGIDGTGVCGCF